MYSNGNITTSCFTVNSLDEIDTSVVQIFPNPTNKICNIQFQSSLHSKITVSIYNMLGQEIFIIKRSLVFQVNFKKRLV